MLWNTWYSRGSFWGERGTKFFKWQRIIWIPSCQSHRLHDSSLGGLYLPGLEGLWWVKPSDVDLMAEFYFHSRLVSAPLPGKLLPTRRCGKPGNFPLLPSNSQWALPAQWCGNTHQSRQLDGPWPYWVYMCQLQEEKAGRKRWSVQGCQQSLQESGCFVHQKVLLQVSQR